jgi:hypothetical protein
MTLGVTFVTLRCVRPNLDALTGEWRAVPSTADRAAHPEAAAPDPLNDRSSGAVIVGAARHRGGRCEILRCDRQTETRHSKRHERAAGGEQVTTVEQNVSHAMAS